MIADLIFFFTENCQLLVGASAGRGKCEAEEQMGEGKVGKWKGESR